MITIETLELLKALQNHKDGELAYVQENGKYYVYKDGEWQEQGSNNPSISLYELNRSMLINEINKQKRSKFDEEKMIQIIDDWAKENKIYFLLYGRESSYFTLFKRNENYKESLGSTVCNCLKNVGKVYEVTIVEDSSAIEIWTEWPAAKTITCMYLFPYDEGVVRFG